MEQDIKSHFLPFEKAVEKYQTKFETKKKQKLNGFYFCSQLSRMLPFIFDDHVQVLGVYETGLCQDQSEYDDEQGEIKAYYKIRKNGRDYYFKCSDAYGSCSCCGDFKAINEFNYQDLLKRCLLDAVTSWKTEPFTDEEIWDEMPPKFGEPVTYEPGDPLWNKRWPEAYYK